jgi:cell division protein FtsX
VTAVWVLRRTVLELRRQGWSLAALAATFALASMLAGGYRLGAAPSALERRGPPSAGPPAEVIAYLRDDLERPATNKLREALTRLPGVERVTLVSGEEALVKLRRQLGERGRLLEGADDGLLPASLEVWLAAGGDPVTRAHQLAWRLQRLDGIVDADVIDARADERAEGWVAAVKQGRTLLLGAVALGGAAVLICGALVGRRRRREEARALLALGFTRRALLAPLVLLASGAALVGSVCGLGAVAVVRNLSSSTLVLAGGLTAGDWSLGLLAAIGLGAAIGISHGVAPDIVDAR